MSAALINGSFSAYCLGTGCMIKCETCQHEKNWQILNEMRDELRKPMQANMANISTTACQITNGRYYEPTLEAASGRKS